MEPGSAVKLPPPQDAAKVRELCRRRERAAREPLRRRGQVRVQEQRTGSRDGDVWRESAAAAGTTEHERTHHHEKSYQRGPCVCVRVCDLVCLIRLLIPDARTFKYVPYANTARSWRMQISPSAHWSPVWPVNSPTVWSSLAFDDLTVSSRAHRLSSIIYHPSHNTHTHTHRACTCFKINK